MSMKAKVEKRDDGLWWASWPNWTLGDTLFAGPRPTEKDFETRVEAMNYVDLWSWFLRPQREALAQRNTRRRSNNVFRLGKRGPALPEFPSITEAGLEDSAKKVFERIAEERELDWIIHRGEGPWWAEIVNPQVNRGEGSSLPAEN